MLRLTDVEEPVGAFHLRDLGDVGEPAMWVPRLPEKPVLVLGSRQDPHAVAVSYTHLTLPTILLV